MDGDGGNGIEQRCRTDEFDLPSVLARLDADDPEVQRGAVEGIRDALTVQPGACTPTVPKLRELLGDPEIDFDEEIAYCLAELAAESPPDVVPSVDALVSFADDQPSSPAAGELLRSLAAIAAERPDAVAEHAVTLADVLECRPGYDQHGLELFRQLATERPAAVEPAVAVLTDALAADPERNGVRSLSALGRLARSETPLPSLEFVDHAMALLDHGDPSLRNNAVGCLADVAHHRPGAVEPARSGLADALEFDDPATRANAAAAIARIAAATEAAVDPARDRLLESLDDENDRVRANACIALGHGDVDAATDRLATLARADPDPTVRVRADWALDRLSHRSHRPSTN